MNSRHLGNKMLNSTQKHKIKSFLGDEVMSEAVKGVLREQFSKARKGDVPMLASQMLAVNMLDEAWKELKKYASQTEKEIREREQVGL